MSEPENVDVDGELDIGWSSYGVPSQTDGETVAGTSDDDKGEVSTEFWPSHINPDDLTDKQRKAIKLALEDPTRSATSIDDAIGSQQYANTILRDKLPEWYENVFKKQGRGRGRPRKTETTTIADADEGSESASGSESELSEVLDVLERTAVHEETVAVIDVVREHLPGDGE